MKSWKRIFSLILGISLAVYVASYEYNMGMEHAQYPSGQYTDTCRTDVLYYALSKDGVRYEGLNNDKAVYYPKGCYQLGSPSVFRKADGTYGLIASMNNLNDQIFPAASNDMIFYGNETVTKLNNQGITVTNPYVEYCEEDSMYKVYWGEGTAAPMYRKRVIFLTLASLWNAVMANLLYKSNFLYMPRRMKHRY